MFPIPNQEAAAEEKGMPMAGLSPGGGGRASLSGGEMRTVRDWDLLKAQCSMDTEGNEEIYMFLGVGLIGYV